MNKQNTYIDLFAGCGGLSLGLHNAGWKGLFAVEKSIDAFSTLHHNLISKIKHFNWPKWLPIQNHDINDIISTYTNNLIDLRGKVDLVAGGPPCQGFSMAGRRVEKDARNNLVNSYIDFIDLVRPKIIFFENVRGFTKGFKKNDKRGVAYSKLVVDKLQNLGYTVDGKLIDFSEYGVPQKRTRYILVGILNDYIQENDHLSSQTFFERIKKNRNKFLINKGLELNPTLESAISDLLKSNGTVDADTPNFKAGVYNQKETSYQKYLRKGISVSDSVNSHRFANHTKTVENRFKVALAEQLTSAQYRERFNLKKSSTKILKADQPTPTITTLPDDYIHYCEPRIMTVREYARIQSFPDSYQFKGKYTTGGKLRTKEVPRYSQIGNAIPPLFGEQAGIIINQILTDG
ncbi:DNA cytosine methyltransferase [Flammeovirga sp. MY04]|uniref:DNA cytosine methyltransferase n=1 Tax=Flammeovirga sp. MY04 TaxID=1191459 RepID=UPI0008061B93|nr:DNA cytosine methyltransferase [Flammeovirga sp. MY04]ANQ50550.1 DNA cytosine methyltransferase [Flammeovirga sp. MY04]